jgi:hypothetical protein
MRHALLFAAFLLAACDQPAQSSAGSATTDQTGRIVIDARFDEASQVASRGASLADRARVVLAGRDPTSDEAHRLQLAWQEADARGERAHLRDRARFELVLLHDPAKANASARASLQDRNEADDALILAAAAAATRDRESLQAVRSWQQRYRYEDVRLESLLGAVR